MSVSPGDGGASATTEGLHLPLVETTSSVKTAKPCHNTLLTLYTADVLLHMSIVRNKPGSMAVTIARGERMNRRESTRINRA